MFVVYIYTKQKFLALKLIRKIGMQSFDYEGMQYNIHPDKIYFKKFLGIKVFPFSTYIQGHPDPIVFDLEKGDYETSQDVPINEIAEIIKLVMRGKLLRIGAIAAIMALFVGIMTFYYEYQNHKNIIDTYNYLVTLRHYIESLNQAPIIP